MFEVDRTWIINKSFHILNQFIFCGILKAKFYGCLKQSKRVATL